MVNPVSVFCVLIAYNYTTMYRSFVVHIFGGWILLLIFVSVRITSTILFAYKYVKIRSRCFCSSIFWMLYFFSSLFFFLFFFCSISFWFNFHIWNIAFIHKHRTKHMQTNPYTRSKSVKLSRCVVCLHNKTYRKFFIFDSTQIRNANNGNIWKTHPIFNIFMCYVIV